MFKNLRKKIEQGVAQSPLRGVIQSGQSANESLTETDGTPTKHSPDSVEPSTGTPPLIAFDNGASPVTSSEHLNTSSPAIGQLVDVPLSDGQAHPLGDMSMPTNNDTPRVTRSRQSSISSVTSESPFFPPLNLLQHHYELPSEAESEMEEPVVSLESYSKEDLYNIIKRLERRSVKYKGRFGDVVAAYKELQQEREKIKTTLTQSQDKAFRRISELKEQSKLDHLAKKDLEENYCLMLEEKGELVKVLQTQVRLLKEGKEVPADIEAKVSGETSSKAGEGDTGGGDSSLAVLQEKVKRQENLLNRCKETIKSHKEKISQLTTEKVSLQQELEKKDGELYKLQEGSDASPSQNADMAKLKSQIKKARQVIEDLEADKGLAIAEAKRQMHEEIEVKDAELKTTKVSLQSMTEENQQLNEKVGKLEKAGEEQLQKSREIIKRLKEEKNHAMQEMEQKLKAFENNMEAEKENLVQELSRGKLAAVDLLQQDLERRVNEMNLEKQKALEERDVVWQEKISVTEQSHQEALNVKNKEREHALLQKDEDVQRILREKEEETKLAIEERDLQKMAALSQQDSAKDEILQEMETIQTAKIELENMLSKAREDYTMAVAAWESEKATLFQTHGEELTRRETQHLENIQKFEKEHQRVLQEKIDTLTETQTRQLDELNQKYQEMIKGSSSEVEEFYKTQLETLKTNHEQIMAEKLSQIERLNLDLVKLNEKLELSRTEAESRIQSEIGAREELVAKYDSEINVLKSDLGILTALKDQLEKTLEMKEDDMKNSQETFDRRLESTNAEWKQRLDNLQSEHSKILGEKCQTDDARVKEAEEKLTIAENLLQQTKADCEELSNQKLILESEREELKVKVSFLSANLEESTVTLTTLKTGAQDLENSMQTAAAEKETLEQSIVSLKVQVENEAHAAADARQLLDSKNEEIANVLKTLEEKGAELNLLDKRCQDLEQELSGSIKSCSEKDAELKQMQDKFGQLRTEAKSRIKELKESTDNLTASHQLEIASISETSRKVISEKDEELKLLTIQLQENEASKSAMIRSLEERLSEAVESQRTLEASFKEKFDERQKQYKDNIQKLKDTLQTKLKAKEEEFHSKLEDLAKQKENDSEGVASNLETLRKQQLDELSASHQMELQATVTEWESRMTEAANISAAEIAQLKSDHDAKLQEAQNSHDALETEMSAAHKVEVTTLQEAVSSFVAEKEAMISEHQTSMKKQEEMISVLEREFTGVQQHVETIVEKHNLEIQEKNEQLKCAGDKIAELEAKNSSVEEMLGNFKNSSQDSETQIIDLTQGHRVAMETLSSLNATLEEKQGIVGELERQLAASETSHRISIQDKDSVIENVKLELETLRTSHDSVVAGKMTQIESLQHERDCALSEKDTMLQNLRDELYTLQVAQQSMNEEKDGLLDELQNQVETLTTSLQVTLEEKEASIADLKQQLETFSREKDQLKVQYEESLQRFQEKMEASVRDQQVELEDRLKAALAEEERLKGKGNRDEERLMLEHKQTMEEMYNDLHEKDKHTEELLQDHAAQIMEKEKEAAEKYQSLQEEITSLQERIASQEESHQKELQEMEKKLQSSFQKRLADRDAAHSEEIDALSKEWNGERKAHVLTSPNDSASTSNQSQELVVQNQLALTAIHSGSTSGDLLRQQIIEQNKKMEEIKSKHKLEMAELRSQLEMTQNRKPLVAPPGHRDLYNEFGQRAAEEIQNLELHNLDLQGEVTHLSDELARLKERDDLLQQKVEEALKGQITRVHPNTPPSSPYPISPNSLAMGPLLNEPTEMEYLRNILYQYMMGKETKTLSRVISTVVKFSDDQVRKIIAHEDLKTSAWLKSP